MSMRKCFFVILFGALWLDVSGVAASEFHVGTVSGRLQYYENNGNYCDDDGRSCNDVRYRRTTYNTYRALRSTQVYLLDNTWNIIGTGQTGSDGRFEIIWVTSGYKPTTGLVVWTAEHSDSRFRMVRANGNTWAEAAGSAFSITGTNDVGNLRFGSASVPNPAANVYAGAELMWRSLNDVSRMRNGFLNLEVWGFYGANDSGPFGTPCPNACAGFIGERPVIHLTSQDAYRLQARILHEMGHIASQVAKRRRQISDYCWPDTRSTTGTGCDNTSDDDGVGVTQNNTWSINSGEWRNSSFEEGLATFLGDTAMYRKTASQPLTCNSVTTCQPAWHSHRTEDSRVTVSSCTTNTSGQNPTNERRSALQVVRFLRDVYDNHNDSNTCGSPGFCQNGKASYNETLNRSLAQMIDVIASFPEGTGNRQHEEPWNSAGDIVNRNGFDVDDYRANYLSFFSVDVSASREANCRN